MVCDATQMNVITLFKNRIEVQIVLQRADDSSRVLGRLEAIPSDIPPPPKLRTANTTLNC